MTLSHQKLDQTWDYTFKQFQAYQYQDFIQALLSTAIFSQKLRFFLWFTKSVNLDLNIFGICISDTLLNFKAYVVHHW